MGINDELSGQAVNAFVSLKEGNETTDQVKKDLIMQVRKSIGPFAAPKAIFIVDDLPKTRSGKIMRRILRKILAGEEDQLGDTSTVSNRKFSYTMPMLMVLVAFRSQRGRQDHRGCSGITKEVGSQYERSTLCLILISLLLSQASRNDAKICLNPVDQYKSFQEHTFHAERRMTELAKVAVHVE